MAKLLVKKHGGGGGGVLSWLNTLLKQEGLQLAEASFRYFPL